MPMAGIDGSSSGRNFSFKKSCAADLASVIKVDIYPRPPARAWACYCHKVRGPGAGTNSHAPPPAPQCARRMCLLGPPGHRTQERPGASGANADSKSVQKMQSTDMRHSGSHPRSLGEPVLLANDDRKNHLYGVNKLIPQVASKEAASGNRSDCKSKCRWVDVANRGAAQKWRSEDAQLLGELSWEDSPRDVE